MLTVPFNVLSRMAIFLMSLSNSSTSWCISIIIINILAEKKKKTKIFQSREDEVLRAELDIPQFLFECCTAYKLVAKDESIDNLKFIEAQCKVLAVFLRNQKESNSTASAMPLCCEAAGPSKAASPLILHGTQPKMPTPAPPAEAAPIQKSKYKSTGLRSVLLAPSKLTMQQALPLALRTSTGQPGPSKLTAWQAPPLALSTSKAQPLPSKLTAMEALPLAPSISMAWPASLVLLKKPTVTNALTMKVVPTKASQPTAAHKEGPPMDQMAQLMMAEKEDQGEVIRVSCPA